MYEWITGEIQHIKSVLQRLDIDWDFILNEPADEQSILDCEADLGILLPDSYRSFLHTFNGAHLFCSVGSDLNHGSPWWANSGIVIQGVQNLQSFQQEMQKGYYAAEWPAIIPFAYLGRLCTGDFCAFEVTQDQNLEYPILDCDHESDPNRWLNSQIALSFEEWLRKIFNRVLLEQKFPEYWIQPDTPLADSLIREIPYALIRQGFKALDNKDYEGADRYFQTIIGSTEAPFHGEAYYGLGKLSFELGDYQASITYCNRTPNPQDIRILNQKGLAFHQLGQYAKAIETLSNALKINSSMGKTYRYRGDAWLQLGDEKRAAEDYQQAERLASQAQAEIILEDVIDDQSTATLIG